jgi:hypothetical protein
MIMTLKYLNKIRVAILITSAVTLFMADAVTAQSGGFAGSYSRMGFGPRGIAAGNVFSSTAFDGVYAHYNPAVAAFNTGNQFDLSSSVMTFDRMLSSVNATFSLPPNAAINAGLIHAGVSDFDGRTLSGYPTERFSINDYQLFVAFGLRTSDRLNLGFGAKVVHASYYDDVNRPWGFGIDLGLTYRLAQGLSGSVTIQDLLTSLTWDTSDLYGTAGSTRKDDRFPTRFKFGLSYVFPNQKWMLGTEYEIRAQSSEVISTSVISDTGGPRIIRSSDRIRTSSAQFRSGTVYKVHERVTLRAGLQILDFDYIEESLQYSAGFSIHLPFDRFSPAVDYAVVQEADGVSLIHVFALRFNL